MALVQHRLDGLEQRCALGAKPVLQCPVGRQGDDETARGAARGQGKLVQFPDQVPADAPQAHGFERTRVRPAPRAGATRSFAPAPDPAPDCAGTWQASRTSPPRATSMRPRHPLNQRLHVLGAVQLTGCDRRHTPAPRAAWSSAASNASNRPMASAHPRRANRQLAYWPCAGAPCHTRVSCPSAPAPHLRGQSLHRRAAPYACAPCASRRAHESNRRAARPGGNTSLTPAAIPFAASFTTTDSPSPCA